MILQMFAIHDRIGGFFSNPFFMASIGLARRALSETVQDSNTTVSRYPTDFSLYHLGEMDNETCKFELLPMPQHICTAASLMPVNTPAPDQEA